MKNLLYLLIVCSVISCAPRELPTIQIITEDHFELKVSHMTTRPEMMVFARNLNRESGILFDFSESLFFDDGHLRSLKFQVVMPKGTAGRANADLMELQNAYFGFIADTSNPSKEYLKVGNLGRP